MNVIENITFPLEKVLKKSPEEAQKIANELLKKYDLLDRALLPISKLSGGQKQRLAIARTVALRPQVICFDEPTSSLDPLLSGYVAQSIQELATEGFIIIISTHDVAILKHLQCAILLMEYGAIIETADSESFFKNPTAFPHIKKWLAGEI